MPWVWGIVGDSVSEGQVIIFIHQPALLSGSNTWGRWGTFSHFASRWLEWWVTSKISRKPRGCKRDMTLSSVSGYVRNHHYLLYSALYQASTMFWLSDFGALHASMFKNVKVIIVFIVVNFNNKTIKCQKSQFNLQTPEQMSDFGCSQVVALSDMAAHFKLFDKMRQNQALGTLYIPPKVLQGWFVGQPRC